MADHNGVPDRFDTYASTYQNTVDQSITLSGESAEYFAELKAQLARSLLGKCEGSRVLEFGCGIGVLTGLLARQMPAAEVHGFDTSEESIRLARDTHGTGRFAHGTSRLPYDSGSFQAAVAANVFHHIEPQDRPYWMAEIKRIVAPGGQILIFEHNPYNPLTRRAVRLCPFDEGVVLLRPRETKTLLSGAGAAVESQRYYFFFPHLLRWLRPLEGLLGRVPLGAQYYTHAKT